MRLECRSDATSILLARVHSSYCVSVYLIAVIDGKELIDTPYNLLKVLPSTLIT